MAASVEGDRYEGLKYNTAAANVYPSDYLVKIPIALNQIEQDRQAEAERAAGGASPACVRSGGPVVYASGGESGSGFVREDDRTGTVGRDMPAAPDTRFFMNVKLNNTRVIRDLQKYLDEVIHHLDDVDGCEVELSLEVSAQAEQGFPPGTVRTVSENCRTLRVENFGFER